MKVTIDVGAELYRAVKVEAARSDRSVREIVDEALAAWLEAAGSREDLAPARQALAEYRQDGGVAAEDFFGGACGGDEGDLRSEPVRSLRPR